MKKQVFQALLVLLASSVLLLGGCGDFDEKKSQKLLGQAESLIEEGKKTEAETLFKEVIAKYPETKSAESAEKYLQEIKRERELAQRQEFAKILDSYRNVFNGYRTMYSAYPDSLATLDKSDYFFDSAYLDEVTPDGYQVYLWLKNDGTGFRAWCVAKEQEQGYAADAFSDKLVPFSRSEILKKINTRFQTEAVSSKLVALQSN